MTDSLNRLKAALADRYAIDEEIGSGGMATVYLAEDLKHQRKVAVKVLRPELAAVLGAQRFVQEITTTANLQHPHILPLFDSGEADGFLYYVMPYIEGETLRDKLNRETQLGIEEAVKITTEVADALDYAHRNNVIHRDIKPENILLHDGRPMVADFGIALAVSAAAGGRMTETGISLGTPHYMSPEQATAEKDLTNRSDIYSLGCVLYEMLTGEPPHTGASAQAIVMKIVTEDVQPVTELRKSVPAHVAAATAKSLEKLPADRFEGAAKFAEALTNPAFTKSIVQTDAPTGRSAVSNALSVKTLGALLAVFVALTLFGWLRPGPSMETRRIAVPPPPGTEFLPDGSTTVALSPDGETVVFVARMGDSMMLYRRSINDFDAEPIPGTEGAQVPFFSPEGEWVGFMTGSPRQVRKVPLAGGPVVTVAETGTFRRDALWRSDETIIIVADGGGLLTVPDRGGTLIPLTVLDTAAGELQHFGPRELDDGRLMFSIATRAGYRLATMAEGEQEWHVLQGDLRSASESDFRASPYYLPEGFLIGRSQGVWYAWPLDIDDGSVLGAGIRVLDEAWTHFSISDRGDVAYHAFPRGGPEAFVMRVDADGIAEPIVALEAGTWRWPRVSPDGTRLAIGTIGTGLAVGTSSMSNNIWVLDLQSGARHRLQTGGYQTEPVWSPDGQKIAFSGLVDSTSTIGIHVWNADGSGSGEVLYAGDFDTWPSSWSTDGQHFAFTGGDIDNDVWVVDLDSTRTLHQVTDLSSDQRNPVFSPDGQWLAYQSDESGRFEVVVVPYPELDAKHPISFDGGTEPIWGQNGRQLYYRNGRRMMRVAVRTAPGFAVGAPEELFRGAFEQDLSRDRSYDVTPDGNHFFLLQADPAAAPELRIVTNWIEELKAKVGNE